MMVLNQLKDENPDEIQAEINYVKEIADAYQAIRDNVVQFRNIV